MGFFWVTDLTKRGINSSTFKFFACKSEERVGWVGERDIQSFCNSEHLSGQLTDQVSMKLFL